MWGPFWSQTIDSLLCQLRSHRILSWRREVVMTIAEKLFVTDRCWENDTQLTLRVWSLINGPCFREGGRSNNIWTTQVGLD